MKKTAILLTLIACILTGCASPKTNLTAYVVAIGEEPENVILVSDIEVLVIDAEYYSAEDIAKIKANNVREVYSYLNIGSMEAFRDYYEEYEVYTLGEYENWPDERWMDVSTPEWQSLLEAKVNDLSQKGIDGFFVDNTDVYYLYPSEEIYRGIVAILSTLKATDKKVILNGGDYFVKTYVESGAGNARLFDGINQESVYTRYDFSANEYTRNSQEEISYYTEYLDMLIEKGYSVYVLEYAVDTQIRDEAYAFAKQREYTCYVAGNIELRVGE